MELQGSASSNSEDYTEDCLYDLLSDPYEFRNLVHNEAYLDIKTDLRERLIRWMVKVGEAAPNIEEAEINEPRGQRVLEPLTFTRRI